MILYIITHKAPKKRNESPLIAATDKKERKLEVSQTESLKQFHPVLNIHSVHLHDRRTNVLIGFVQQSSTIRTHVTVKADNSRE